MVHGVEIANGQALWYRTLVDAKVTEITQHAEAMGGDYIAAIRDRTGLDITPRPEIS